MRKIFFALMFVIAMIVMNIINANIVQVLTMICTLAAFGISCYTLYIVLRHS